MKTKSTAIIVLLMLVMAGVIHAQVAFDYGSSSWGGSGAFSGSASAGATVSGSQAYYGAIQADTDTYVFGFSNTATPSTTASYNLSSTVLTSGTALTLTFTGFSAAPLYVGYTGGALTGYTYNSGTMTISATTTNPVASASDTDGTTLGSSFGMMIVTGGTHDFQGTVFRTDMFYQDLTPLEDYTGTSFIAGLNASGIDGQTGTFNAYLPITFLNSVGIYSPQECEARLQHENVSGTPISITREVYAGTGADPFGGGPLYTWMGVDSTLDFDGSGADNYILATYTNDSWSQADIGVIAVPEPSTYAMIIGSFAFGLAIWRRRIG